MNRKILTIQDISCVGQCSLTVALPLLSACGIETAVLPSAVLSTHTAGFKNYTFRDLTGDMPAIEAHWISEKIRFDAVYTGYVGKNQIAPILDICRRCTHENAVRFVDPVMGDNGKLYSGFDDDFPEAMKELCRGADYLLPNFTEAAFLIGETPQLEGHTPEMVERIVEKLHAIGAKNVILTGVSYEPDKLGCAVSDGNQIRTCFNDKIDRVSHGTGDVFASVFAGAVMRGIPAFDAAKLAADFVCLCIRNTPPDHWYGVCFESGIPLLTERLSRF